MEDQFIECRFFSLLTDKEKMQTAGKVAIFIGIVFILLIMGYLLYRWSQSDSTQPIKCPKQWNKQNSPICPQGSQIDPQSDCNCIPCSDDANGGTTKTS